MFVSSSTPASCLVSLDDNAVAQLIMLASGTDEAALAAEEQLIQAHHLWFECIVRKLNIPRSHMDDALQGARIGFQQAIQRFDATRGYTLRTFAYQHVKGAILKAVFGSARHARRRGRYEEEVEGEPAQQVLYLSQMEGDHLNFAYYEQGFDELEGDEPIDASKKRRLHSIREWVAQLPPGQRDLVERMFWHNERQADIARARGVSRKAIHEQLDRVIKKGRRALQVA